MVSHTGVTVVSYTGGKNLPPVSTTGSKFATNTASVIDIGGKFAAGVIRGPFRAQKSLDFQGTPLPIPLVMDLARLKTIRYRAI